MHESIRNRQASTLFLAIGLMVAGCKSTEQGPSDAPASSPSAPEESSAAPAAQEHGDAAQAAVEVRTEEVEYEGGGATLHGFLAYPANAEGEVPGVLVVHEWWGQNEYARSRAKQLAELGYAALALDMFGEGKTTTHPADAQKFTQEVMQNEDTAKQRFMAGYEFLAQQPMVDATKLAAIGYCFGGGVVLQMARSGVDLDAVASFHGMLGTQEPMKKGEFSGKILVAHGGADPMVSPEQVEAIQEEMNAAGVDLELHVYDDAKHGFTNPNATAVGKAHDMPLAYDAQADEDSWKELRELLAQVWPRA